MSDKKNKPATVKVVSWPGYRVCPRCHASDTKVKSTSGNVRSCECVRGHCREKFKETGTWVEVPKAKDSAPEVK